MTEQLAVAYPHTVGPRWRPLQVALCCHCALTLLTDTFSLGAWLLRACILIGSRCLLCSDDSGSKSAVPEFFENTLHQFKLQSESEIEEAAAEGLLLIQIRQGQFLLVSWEQLRAGKSGHPSGHGPCLSSASRDTAAHRPLMS